MVYEKDRPYCKRGSQAKKKKSFSLPIFHSFQRAPAGISPASSVGLWASLLAQHLLGVSPQEMFKKQNNKKSFSFSNSKCGHV